MSNKDECCFAKMLKVIDVLQRNADKYECAKEGCDKPFLGTFNAPECFNTRPVTFYRCDGSMYTIDYQFNGTTLTSCVFRVEKVEDCCVTVSILAPNPASNDDVRPYVATNQFATINLKCVCVLKCLPDVIIDCL